MPDGTLIARYDKISLYRPQSVGDRTYRCQGGISENFAGTANRGYWTTERTNRADMRAESRECRGQPGGQRPPGGGGDRNLGLHSETHPSRFPE